MDRPDHFLPFGTDCDDEQSLPPAMRQTAMRLYQQAWEAYEKAGYPYGTSDRALLLWYTFHGAPAGSADAPRVSSPRRN